MKAALLSVIALLLLKCNHDPTSKLRFRISPNKTKVQWGDTLKLRLSQTEELPGLSITYQWDGETISDTYLVAKQPLGTHRLSAKVTYEGKLKEIQKKITLIADTAPRLYNYEILNEFPHDKTAYTQGLEFDGDTLYESTGRKGQSSLRKVDFTTGEPWQNIPLDTTYFGEGLTLMNKKIYQLTWQSKKGFVYDQTTLALQKAFDYGESVEGWGLCNDGKQLYKSDGTNRIYILDPETLNETGYIEVMTHKGALEKINELEWVDGKIYANTYQFEKEVAVIIEPKTGKVEGVINFAGLKNKVEQHPTLDVLNGIAYHPSRKTFFVTGKNWSRMFEVKIQKK